MMKAVNRCTIGLYTKRTSATAARSAYLYSQGRFTAQEKEDPVTLIPATGSDISLKERPIETSSQLSILHQRRYFQSHKALLYR